MKYYITEVEKQNRFYEKNCAKSLYIYDRRMYIDNFKFGEWRKIISMREVQVLQATKTAPNSRGRNNNYVVQIDRIRVTAYCRVSTDGDEQLGSFESQKLYYEEKIKNGRWQEYLQMKQLPELR